MIARVNAKIKKGGNLQRGQALIEIIPAILIFVMIISACLRYFEVFRSAVETEQVARNLMMAKIANSGTLTTPPSQLVNRKQTTPQDRNTGPLKLDSIEASVLDTNVFVDPTVTCFTVFPPGWMRQYPMTSIFSYGGGAGGFPSVQLTTYARMCRRPP